MVQDDSGTIQVILRLRPCSATVASCVQLVGDRTVRLTRGNPQERPFEFDYVADESCSQETVFQVAGRRAVQKCLEGVNSCVLAYGQTGSGKTFTILGEGTQERRGLITRTFEQLFCDLAERSQSLCQQGELYEYTVTMSLLQIYNERISDLLGHTDQSLQMWERNGSFCVQGLQKVQVHSAEEAMAMLGRGLRKRNVAATNLNAVSSRSHCILTCELESKHTDRTTGTTKRRYGRLNIVDLAGSECLANSGAAGEHREEAININQSLTVLGRVMSALVKAQASRDGGGVYVPYRASILTRLLKDSLGGNSKTVLIATASPAEEQLASTRSTLNFASQAKKIRNKVVVNEEVVGEAHILKNVIHKMQAKMDRLEREAGHGRSQAAELAQLKQRLVCLEEENASLKRTLDATRSQQSPMRRLGGKQCTPTTPESSPSLQKSQNTPQSVDHSPQVEVADMEQEMQGLRDTCSQLLSENMKLIQLKVDVERERDSLFSQLANLESKLRSEQHAHEEVAERQASAAQRACCLELENAGMLQELIQTQEALAHLGDIQAAYQLSQQKLSESTAQLAEASSRAAALQDSLERQTAAAQDAQLDLRMALLRIDELEAQQQEAKMDKALLASAQQSDSPNEEVQEEHNDMQQSGSPQNVVPEGMNAVQEVLQRVLEQQGGQAADLLMGRQMTPGTCSNLRETGQAEAEEATEAAIPSTQQELEAADATLAVQRRYLHLKKADWVATGQELEPTCCVLDAVYQSVERTCTDLGVAEQREQICTEEAQYCLAGMEQLLQPVQEPYQLQPEVPWTGRSQCLAEQAGEVEPSAHPEVLPGAEGEAGESPSQGWKREGWEARLQFPEAEVGAGGICSEKHTLNSTKEGQQQLQAVAQEGHSFLQQQGEGEDQGHHVPIQQQNGGEDQGHHSPDQQQNEGVDQGSHSPDQQQNEGVDLVLHSPGQHQEEEGSQLHHSPVQQLQEAHDQVRRSPLQQQQEREEQEHCSPLQQQQEREEQVSHSPLQQQPKGKDQLRLSSVQHQQEVEDQLHCCPLQQQQECAVARSPAAWEGQRSPPFTAAGLCAPTVCEPGRVGTLSQHGMLGKLCSAAIRLEAAAKLSARDQLHAEACECAEQGFPEPAQGVPGANAQSPQPPRPPSAASVEPSPKVRGSTRVVEGDVASEGSGMLQSLKIGGRPYAIKIKWPGSQKDFWYYPATDLVKNLDSNKGSKGQKWANRHRIRQPWKENVTVGLTTFTLQQYLSRCMLQEGKCHLCGGQSDCLTDNHPQVQLPLCASCHVALCPHTWHDDAAWQTDGTDDYCRICRHLDLMPMAKSPLLLCDRCSRGYCVSCIFVYTKDDLLSINEESTWLCPRCSPRGSNMQHLDFTYIPSAHHSAAHTADVAGRGTDSPTPTADPSLVAPCSSGWRGGPSSTCSTPGKSLHNTDGPGEVVCPSGKSCMGTSQCSGSTDSSSTCSLRAGGPGMGPGGGSNANCVPGQGGCPAGAGPAAGKENGEPVSDASQEPVMGDEDPTRDEMALGGGWCKQTDELPSPREGVGARTVSGARESREFHHVQSSKAGGNQKAVGDLAAGKGPLKKVAANVGVRGSRMEGICNAFAKPGRRRLQPVRKAVDEDESFTPLAMRSRPTGQLLKASAIRNDWKENISRETLQTSLHWGRSRQFE